MMEMGEVEAGMIWKEYFEGLYIQIPRKKLQFRCVVLMRFGEATTSEGSRSGDLN